MAEERWVHPVKRDERYAQVQRLVQEGREDEAQKLEEAIWADVRKAGYQLYSFES